MEVGTSGHVFRGPGDERPLEALYREVIDEGIAAEADGFDFYSVSELHFVDSQWNPSPLMVLAAIAARTSTIRLGPCVLVTPFYHPLRLAEDVATLDLTSSGRIDLVAGTGADLANQFQSYAISVEERFGRTFEALRILRRCFREEAFDHDGRYYAFKDVRMTTRPIQDPFPIWFAGFGPKNSRRAGRAGYHYHASADGLGVIAEWREGLVEGGHDVGDFNLGVHGAEVYVRGTKRDAEAAHAKLVAQSAAHAADYRAESEGHRARAITPFVGTPDEALTHLEPVLKDSDITHFVLSGDREGFGDQQLWLDEVAPVLRNWGRSPVAPAASAS